MHSREGLRNFLDSNTNKHIPLTLITKLKPKKQNRSKHNKWKTNARWELRKIRKGIIIANFAETYT